MKLTFAMLESDMATTVIDEIESSSDNIDLAGGTGNWLPVLRSNKRF